MALLGCAPSPPPDWERKDIVDHFFGLINPTVVEQFIFKDDGTVGACLGTKNVAVMGPVLQWKLEGQWLHISGGEEVPGFDMKCQLITRDGATITVSSKERKTWKYKVKAVDSPK